MIEYRIYLASAGGRVSGIGTGAKCASDKEACALAQRMLEGHDQAEVWVGTRCVGQVSAASAADIAALGRSWGFR